MNWTQMLRAQMEDAYRCADGLMALVDDDALGWKPAGGENWMTTGQLLEHMDMACGWCCRGFVTGEWGMPGAAGGEAPPDDMLPSAQQMPSAESVAAARGKLAADREVAFAMLAEAGENDLAKKSTTAPWNPTPRLLGVQFMECVKHLDSHRHQLFYYLKLLGKPVNTMHLWGMAGG